MLTKATQLMIWHVAANATIESFEAESELKYVTDAIPGNESNLFDYFTKARLEVQTGN